MNGTMIMRAIFRRRSIRRFDDTRGVEKKKIIALLKCAMAAPSACNIQPWDFIVVDDRKKIDEIKGSIERYGDYNVPVIIVITGNNEFIPWKDNGIVDCALAMGNIMIAAPSLGLGTVCIGGFDRARIKGILGIPDGVAAIGMVYLGYPKEKKPPRTKYLEEAVHWNAYDAERGQNPRKGNIIVFGPEASV